MKHREGYKIAQIGSKQNGTVRSAEILALNKNELYLCSAFETQVRHIKY